MSKHPPEERGRVLPHISYLKLMSILYCALSRVCLWLLFCFMYDVTKCSILHLLTWSKFKVSCQPPLSIWSFMLHSFWYISPDENLHSCKNQWSCWKRNLKGLKDNLGTCTTVCHWFLTDNIDSHSIEWAVCNVYKH